jgi:multicomponent Na+:H+ antiporter subunit C
MIGVTLACLVAVLLGTGAYLLMQRSPIRLVLGLGLLSHGINLLLFGTGALKRGLPPIVLDKASFTGDISAFVDPLPQALILTAIVISFGITAFMIALLNRRNSLLTADGATPPERQDDPLALQQPAVCQPIPDDYEWLEEVPRQETGSARAWN